MSEHACKYKVSFSRSNKKCISLCVYFIFISVSNSSLYFVLEIKLEFREYWSVLIIKKKIGLIKTI